MRKLERLALLNETGRELAGDVDPVVSWPDGTPHWCRVQIAPSSSGPRRVCIRPTASRAPSLDLDFPLERSASSSSPRCFQFRDCSETLSLTGDSLILQAGRAAAAIKIVGSVLEVEGCPTRLRPRSPPSTHHRSGSLDVRWDLDPSDPGVADSCVVEFRCRWRLRRLDLEIRCRALKDCTVRHLKVHGSLSGGPFLVQGSKSGEWRPLARHARFEAGDVTRSPPVAWKAETGFADLMVRWQEIGYGKPAALDLHDDGSFVADLCGGGVELRRGQEWVHHLEVERGTGESPGLTRAFAVPEECATLPEQDRAFLCAWEALIAAWLKRPQRLEDRGCYPSSDGGFANGEFDLGGSLIDLGKRTRRASAIRCGLVMVEHQLCFDRAADSPEGWPQGLFWMHGRDHHSDRLEAGHLWADGLVQRFQAEGCMESLEAAVDLARACGSLLSREDFIAGPERRLAWPLRALCDVAQVQRDPSIDSAANGFIDRLLRRQQPAGFLDGDRRNLEGREVIWVNSWVSLGITADALARAARIFGRADAHAAALSLVRFVVREALQPEGMAEVLEIDPGTLEVSKRHGRCRKGELGFAAGGVALLSEDAAHSSLAEGLWSQARAELAVPRVEDLVELAKALQGLRSLRRAPPD